MTEALQRVSAFFDGDLAHGEQVMLREWLLESRDHVDQYVVESFVHAQLIDLLNAHQIRANALVAAEMAPSAASTIRTRRLIGRLLALAVSIAFVFALVYLIVSRPTVVATVTGTADVKWGDSTEKRTVGALLKSGDELALDRGTLHISFAQGGQVVLHGPARFRLDSEASGRLLQGSLLAFVPEHAVGFTVRTGKISVVDLGTEFYIGRSADESCDLQVFNGLVEVLFDQQKRTLSTVRKLQISQGRAIRIDDGTEAVNAIEYNPAIRLPSSAWSQ